MLRQRYVIKVDPRCTSRKSTELADSVSIVNTAITKHRKEVLKRVLNKGSYMSTHVLLNF